MNCLHCGKQLALFTKLRGEDVFCSGEHRELFFKTHQRIALDRLRTSSGRLKARRHALLHPPADPDPASCGFVAQITGFEEHNWLSVFSSLAPELLAWEPDVWLPSYSVRNFASARMCGLAALPSLYPLKGAFAPRRIEAEAGAWSSRLAFLITGRYLDAAPLFAAPIRSRGVRLANSETAAMQEQDPEFGSVPAVPQSPSFQIPAAQQGLGQTTRLLGLGRPSTADQPLQQSGVLSEPLASASAPAIPAFTLTGSEAAPVPVNRIFRARVRSGVDDSGITPFHAIDTVPQLEAGKPAIPQSTAPVLRSAPQAPSRWIGGRSAPVDGHSTAMSRASIESLSDHRMQPRMQASAATENTLVPPASERFFKARPRGPVQGLSIPGWEPIDAGETSWQAEAPRLDRLGVTAGIQAQPQFLERVYRMRPRNPVPDRTALEGRRSSRGPHASPLAFEGKALFPSVRNAGLAAEPLFSERLFRPMPRTGIGSSSIPAFQPNEPQAAALAPAAPTTAPSAQVTSPALEAPLPTGRLHNPRPAEALVDAGLSSFHPVEAPAVSFIGSEPVTPFREAPEGNTPEPVFLENLFHPRLRSGVQDDNLAASEALPAGQPHIPAPVVHHPATPVAHVAALAPAFIQRLFRPRPRNGVDSGVTALHVDPSAAPLENSAAQYPATPVAGADFEPAPLNRFFRPRPRGAAADPSLAAFMAISPGSPEQPAIEMEFPVMPALLMRHNRVAKEKPIRMRPRPAAPEQADDSQPRPESRPARQVS